VRAQLLINHISGDSIMSTRIRFARTVLTMAAILSIAMAFAPTTASADSPCDIQQVVNNTSCAFMMHLYNAGGKKMSFAIAAGPGVSTPISLGSFVPAGALDGLGNLYPFSGLPSPGCTQCFSLNLAVDNCCAFICYNEGACSFTVDACPSPC
jgi:hypothetical protein